MEDVDILHPRAICVCEFITNKLHSTPWGRL